MRENDQRQAPAASAKPAPGQQSLAACCYE